MQRDQFRLRRDGKRVAHHDQDSTAWQQWQQRLQDSIALREARRQSIPDCQLDAELPIAQHAAAIREAIRDHQVVVLSGETGSGKSTQLPLICLQLGLGESGFIGHTQPRRIAARGVANRIAQQLGSPLGDQVGFKIRFSDQTKPHTLVKVMTDGILLAETTSDRFLDQYQAIIIDEAHERSLNIDFLMGYLKRKLPQRPDLKLIITSATIDTERFAEHFTMDGGAPVPVIHVEGRNYPVEVCYRPPGYDADGNRVEQDSEQATIDSILELTREPGDILVFLPTEFDIRNLHKKLRQQAIPGGSVEILPLYARLSTEQQNRVFRPQKQRRIVLATNVAESSITVPGIRFVVDTGTARISRYAPRSKVQRLPIEAISQASADQRAGRCGRVGPGVCIRLYSEEDYQQRAKFTTPEIRRTNLASVILQTKALRLGAIEEFPFLEPPRPEAIRDGYRTLLEIGAVDEARNLTPLGKRLSRLPVDPRIGRMLYAANEQACLHEMLVVASALEIQDPRMRPSDQQAAADEQHAKFIDARSDFVSILNMWDFVSDLKAKLSRSQFRKACQQNFLSHAHIQQWLDVHRQLKSMVRDQGLTIQSKRDDPGALHRALISGLLSGVAMLSDKREYTGAGGVKFRLWPGSGIVKQATASTEQTSRQRNSNPRDPKVVFPKWVLVGEILETSQRYGRNAAAIDVAEVETLAQHLVKRSYSDPFWSQKRQSAMAYERVTLFGLPIVTRRAVRYGAVAPEISRTLLIEEGLTRDQMKGNFPFLRKNRETLQQIEQLAAKTRDRNWVIDHLEISRFYHERLPDEVVDGGTLAAWFRADPAAQDTLCFSIDTLRETETSSDVEQQFPDSLTVGDLQLPVHYKFSPGVQDDGVTVQVPLAGVAQLHENHLDWGVPGTVEERVIALIRSLPKAVRRLVVPAPDTARWVASRLVFGEGSFWQAVAEQLSLVAEQPITADQFRMEKIDAHLRMNVQVCDDEGEVLAEARSLRALREQLPGGSESAEIHLADGEGDFTWHQDEVTDWTWDELPKEMVVRRGIADVPLFPALIDQGDSIQLRLLDQRALAERKTRVGLATLYRIAHRKLIRSQVQWLPQLNALSLLAHSLYQRAESKSPHGRTSQDRLKWDLGQLISRLAFVEGRPLIRSREEFEARSVAAAESVGVATQRIAPWLAKFLESYQQIQLQCEQWGTKNAEVKEDIEKQLDILFADQFLCHTPWRWLEHYPRYLQAILVRLDRLRSGGADRDQQIRMTLAPFCERWEMQTAYLEKQASFEPELETFGWMIQELRVSLFAQQLGTSETVSEKRLEKQWKKVERHS